MEFGDYIIDVDVERTHAFYQSAPGIECDCAGCRNYPLAVETLPETVQGFFRSLGIDPLKPAEIYTNCTNKDGTLWYGGWYHLCGSLVQGGRSEKERSTGVGLTPVLVSDRFQFQVAFTEDIWLLEDGFPAPVLQMEIDISLPWMLEEPNTYPRM